MKNESQPGNDFPKIGMPATRALEAAGYTSLKQLTKVSEAELGQLHGMGQKALGLLREALKSKGWSFRQGKADEKLKMKQDAVNDLPKLAAPAARALQSAGITNLKQLTSVSEEELMQLHGMGRNALATLREALKSRGLSFRESSTRGGKMDKNIRTHLDNICSDDGQLQNTAYHFLMEKTEKPVDWAYEAWDELVEGLTHKDNHVRAISSQLLANLAKSDPKGRMFKDFDKLLNVTKDERFVTARHCLQSIWKVGLAGKNAQIMVVKGLEKRYHECVTEKNCTMIRYDIIVDLRNLYDATTSSEIKEKALELIELEEDAKYKKKYATVWKK